METPLCTMAVAVFVRIWWGRHHTHTHTVATHTTVSCAAYLTPCSCSAPRTPVLRTLFHALPNAAPHIYQQPQSRHTHIRTC